MNKVLIHPFEPFMYHEAKILILGSFPSVTSLEKGFYYMHPRNRFYKILSALFCEDFVHAHMDAKKQLLKKHKIALYDMIATCERKGSLDASIKRIQPVDLKTFLMATSIRCIGLNGSKAYRLYKRFFGDLPYDFYALPSSSPANARITFDDAIRAWSVIKLY